MKEQEKQLIKYLIREALWQKTAAALRTPVGSLFRGAGPLRAAQFMSGLQQEKLEPTKIVQPFTTFVNTLKRFNINTGNLENSVALGFFDALAVCLGQLKSQVPRAIKVPELWAAVGRVSAQVRILANRDTWNRVLARASRAPQTLVTPKIVNFAAHLRNNEYGSTDLMSSIEGWEDFLAQTKSSVEAEEAEQRSQEEAKRYDKHSFNKGDFVDEIDGPGKHGTVVDVPQGNRPDAPVVVRWSSGDVEKLSREKLAQARPLR